MDIILMIFFALCFVGIPVTIGFMVYHDAKSLGMEPLLWTMVAVLVPSFIGLIVYLIVRRGYSAVTCASCGHNVQDGFVTCPYCGSQLKYRCVGCGAPVESDWCNCPQCSENLPKQQSLKVSAQKSFKGLWVLLLSLIIVPCIILFFLILRAYEIFPL